MESLFCFFFNQFAFSAVFSIIYQINLIQIPIFIVFFFPTQPKGLLNFFQANLFNSLQAQQHNSSPQTSKPPFNCF